MASKKKINASANNILASLAALVILAAITAIIAIKSQDTRFGTSATAAGNGAPSGPHYNLNIIGVPKGKSADMIGSSGRRIFVALVGTCKINLSQGTFQVLDGNCTDNGHPPSNFRIRTLQDRVPPCIQSGPGHLVNLEAAQLLPPALPTR